MTDRFDKFTERARKSLQLAQQEAASLNHNYLGPEHILLGLVREGDSIAARVLNSLGVTLDRARAAVETELGKGRSKVSGSIGLTPGAKRVIELAVDEARKLNHHYIGAEHLLLGLMRLAEDRQVKPSLLTRVLKALALSPQAVQAQVLDVLRSSSGYSSTTYGWRTPASLVAPSWPSGGIPPHEFYWLTERARFALQLAHEEATLLHHEYIGTEHILLGLLRELPSIAARVLREMGVTLEAAREARAQVETALGAHPPEVETDKFTPLATHAIGLAREESSNLGYHYVGTEHILLAITRQPDSVAVAILSHMGIDRTALRGRLLAALSTSKPGEPTPSPFKTRPASAPPPRSGETENRFDKFTEWARKTLQLAQEEAQRFNHNYIGTEHILLGLLRQPGTMAARVLNNLGIELSRVRSAVEFIIGRRDRIVMGEIGLTPRAKRAIELAADEARRLKHHYIGTEHLLLGLVREGEGIAAGVLESLGVSLEKVRAAVIKEVKTSDPTDEPSEEEDRVIFTRAISEDDHTAGLIDWMSTNRTFSLLGKVDDSFLAAIHNAVPIAIFLAHNYLGTDHILSAMLRDNDSAASRLLREAGADLNQLNAIVDGGVGVMWAGIFTYHAMRSIQLAIDEAASAGQLPATSEHLLLGIILEGTSTGAAALLNAGVTTDSVRALIQEGRSPGDG